MSKLKTKYEKPSTDVVILELEHLLQTRGSSFTEDGTLWVWDISKEDYVDAQTHTIIYGVPDGDAKPGTGGGSDWSPWAE